MTATSRKAFARGRPARERINLYEEITTQIIAELEEGSVPWVKPWGRPDVSAPLAMPVNAATGRRYSGINVLMLWGAVVKTGFACQSWVTFRQAVALGGHVRKGERGTTVVYVDRFVPDDERKRARDTGDEPQAIPFLRRFTVFNIEQCDNLPEDVTETAPPVETDLILPQAKALIDATEIDVRIGGDRAFYDVTDDYVRVPPPQAYFEPVDWHRTALHELSHASGASHRLGRDMSGSFGSKTYAFEELIAEISTAFVCASLDIVPSVRHSDYIAKWLRVIKQDNRAIVRAASEASKAADYLLSFAPHAANTPPDLSRESASRPATSTARREQTCGGVRSAPGSMLP